MVSAQGDVSNWGNTSDLGNGTFDNLPLTGMQFIEEGSRRLEVQDELDLGEKEVVTLLGGGSPRRSARRKFLTERCCSDPGGHERCLFGK
nr:hypothetical protein Itr_chr06CG13460 [Ipomoea trifida]GME07722.1 hypothetical protein Iba_scaffold6462CG0330 [Ipomoea batatas]